MRTGTSNRVSRTSVAGVITLAFVAHALIPQGFMPAAGRPWSLEICPEGFPAQLLRHAGHHHDGRTHSYTEHCLFGSAPTSGPVLHLPLLTDPHLTELIPATYFISRVVRVQLVYLPHARGPPIPV